MRVQGWKLDEGHSGERRGQKKAQRGVVMHILHSPHPSYWPRVCVCVFYFAHQSAKFYWQAVVGGPS